MYPLYHYHEGSPLHEDDIKGIQYLYGEAGEQMGEQRRGRGSAVGRGEGRNGTSIFI